jgi:glycerol-1-phosphate dehydrogenase [NAD(P)+]
MLLSRSIQIPVFLRVGAGLLGELGDLLREHHLRFDTPLVVTSPTGERLAAARVARALDAESCVVVRDNGPASIAAVRDAIRSRRADVVVGVGGGTPLDVAKFVAAGERVSFLSVPTTPSNDGIASPIAVVREGDRPESRAAAMPIGVIADLDVLREAPLACVRAGIGDLLANVSAVADWELACRRGHDRMDDFARLLALAGAEAMLRFADASDAADLRSLELLETLINGLVLSGVAMEIAGSSRPASGAEHLFSHALDRIAAHPAMHGTQVGIGTLLMTRLREEDGNRLRDGMLRLDLPVRASEIGIVEDEIVAGLVHARETRPDRYTLLDEITVTPARALEVARATGVV